MQGIDINNKEDDNYKNIEDENNSYNKNQQLELE